MPDFGKHLFPRLDISNRRERQYVPLACDHNKNSLSEPEKDALRTKLQNILSGDIGMRWFMYPRYLKIFNRLAAGLHLVLASLVISRPKDLVYSLHLDGTFYVPSDPSHPIFNIPIAASAAGICDMATDNSFRPGNGLTLTQVAYPKGVPYQLSLKALMAGFFFLSFAFQWLGVEVVYKLFRSQPHWKYSMYDEQYGPDFPTEIGDHYENRDTSKCYSGSTIHALATVNYVRYVEYSISASVMILTISLLSGSANMETLVYMFVLSAACMILGWLADFLMRLRFIVEILQLVNSGSIGHLPKACGRMAWVAHLLGWLCLAAPWYFIMTRFVGLFSEQGGCDPPSNLAAQGPPDWLISVFVIELFLFLSFGFVQVYQFLSPQNRMWVEYLYIMLSVLAKGILGMLVSWVILV